MFKTFPAILLYVLILPGCASVQGPAPAADPLESFNRTSFAFNEKIDDVLLKPAAQGYAKVTPDFVRGGVGNAFGNVGDILTAVNNLLQGKIGDAASDVGRVLVNTTFGILGLWDVATPMGLEKHQEDFGQTLGKWGLGSGPYLVIPFLGPSTMRDSIGRFADAPLGTWSNVQHIPTRNSLFAVDGINTRASLLGAGETLDTAALDKYNFLRDAYLQRRLRMTYDGKPPRDKLDALDESLESPAAGK